MYRLMRRFSFEASHVLTYYEGACSRLHGHTWQGELWIMARHLKGSGSEEGMVIDFKRLAVAIDMVLRQLDHQHLNDSLGMKQPTSERVCKWLYDAFVTVLTQYGTLTVEKVVLEETRDSRCEYDGE